MLGPSPHYEKEEIAHAPAQWDLLETGVIVAQQRPHRLEVAERIKTIEGALDKMTEKWHPRAVACGKASVMQLPHQREGAELLNGALERWAAARGLPLYCYPLKEIMSSIGGPP